MAKKVTDAVVGKFGKAGGAAIERIDSVHADEIVSVAAAHLVEVARFLRDDPAMQFDCPVFVTCIDLLHWPHETTPSGGPVTRTADEDLTHRFEVVYQLRSSTHRHRIRLKVRVAEAAGKPPTLPSLATMWPGFDWQERETFDMYGIRFEGHPDLRRIYLYDEFEGHPLRKDYPKDRRQPLVRRPDLPDQPVKGSL